MLFIISMRSYYCCFHSLFKFCVAYKMLPSLLPTKIGSKVASYFQKPSFWTLWNHIWTSVVLLDRGGYLKIIWIYKSFDTKYCDKTFSSDNFWFLVIFKWEEGNVKDLKIIAWMEAKLSFNNIMLSFSEKRNLWCVFKLKHKI